jgi:putative copper export protein
VRLLTRFLEFLPLALVLGTALAALRNERMEAIQRAALRNTLRILVWLVAGCVALQAVLWVVQD